MFDELFLMLAQSDSLSWASLPQSLELSIIYSTLLVPFILTVTITFYHWRWHGLHIRYEFCKESSVFFQQCKIATTRQQEFGWNIYIKLDCLSEIMKCWCKFDKMFVHLGDTLILFLRWVWGKWNMGYLALLIYKQTYCWGEGCAAITSYILF